MRISDWSSDVCSSDLPATALSKTYNTDAQTPDSAGTMTAIATGVKNHIGVIDVSAGSHNDCAQSLDHHLQSWLALAADAGIGTGIVPTARPTYATPAPTSANVPYRGWGSNASLPVPARDAG